MDIIFTLDNLAAAAKQFVLIAVDRRVVAFNGEMGAGKTTFIHAVCEELGVKEDTIGSPTFSIINQYQSTAGQAIYHIDLYRLKGEEEAIQAGVEDCLYSGNYCFVEWPGKAASLFPENTLQVQLLPVDNHTRKLIINL